MTELIEVAEFLESVMDDVAARPDVEKAVAVKLLLNSLYQYVDYRRKALDERLGGFVERALLYEKKAAALLADCRKAALDIEHS